MSESISGTYQSWSITVAAFAMSRVTVAQSEAAPSGSSSASATTAASPATTPTTPATAPASDTVKLSGASRRADVLLSAVDADHDGAVSEQEFTEGAMRLLRRAGSRRLHHKLEKLFDRVDADQDGTISKGELTSALEQAAARRKGCRPGEQSQATCRSDSQATGMASVTSVTFVAVAITRYTAVAQSAAAQSTTGQSTTAAPPAAPSPSPSLSTAA